MMPKPRPGIITPETRYEESKPITTKEEAREALIEYYKKKIYGAMMLTPENLAKNTAIRKALKLAESGNLLPLKTHLEGERHNPKLEHIYKILFNSEPKNESFIYEKVYGSREEAKKAGVVGGFVAIKDGEKIKYIPVNSKIGQDEIRRR